MNYNTKEKVFVAELIDGGDMSSCWTNERSGDVTINGRTGDQYICKKTGSTHATKKEDDKMDFIGIKYGLNEDANVFVMAMLN